MRHPGNNTHTKRVTALTFSVRLGALIVVLTVFALVTAASASASYETVGHFGGVLKAPEVEGQFPEEVQEGGVTAIAVNEDGAGGVAPGTLYTVAGIGGGNEFHIARFSPGGAFEEAWDPVMRCGPAAEEPTHPTCPPFLNGFGNVDVEIDQSTGNVYVLDKEQFVVEKKEVKEGKEVIVETRHAAPDVLIYTPDGKLISRFGEGDPEGTIAESPAKTHEQSSTGGIAVNDSGEVYLFDEDKTFHHRLMLFRPETPGDYEHYVYAGQGSDVASAPSGTPFDPEEPVLDADGNIYVGGETYIAEYDPAQPAEPICTFKLTTGGIVSNAVNPVTREVFFYDTKDRKIHQLSCGPEGKFVEEDAFNATPQRGNIEALAVDPGRQFEPSRPAGVLYAAAGAGRPNTGGGGDFAAGPLGYILALPKEVPPSVESESISNVTSSTASLGAQINPKGSLSRYAFQYLDDAAYEANEPDERQSLTVSATGGVFGLGFEGRRLGGPASANLTAGSDKATALTTAKGTATLKGAVGTGTLKGAKGKGTSIAGSNVITSVSVGEGEFKVGQGIAGAGIPATDAESKPIDTTIIAVRPEAGLPTVEIAISRPATKSATAATVTSGAKSLTEVSTSEGHFEVGQAIQGPGIPTGTTISAVSGSELGLSRPATVPITGLELHAGFPVLTSVSSSLGSFEVGQTIKGEGIPAGTEVGAVDGNELTLFQAGALQTGSKLPSAVTKPGTGVAISSLSPAPWAVGERVEGPGIPQGTTITSIPTSEEIQKKGQVEVTLSNAATASGTGVILHAGLPADASAARVRAALEDVHTVGQNNVRVSGGPGDETGSNPYEITFTGDLENVDVPELTADASGLSGGPATATVQTENDGGGGFAGAVEVPSGGAALGSGSSAISVVAPLSGLAPDTGYHFRATATSHCSAIDEAKVCEGVGSSLAFHTAPGEASALPDNRAYELVSPAQKNGGQVIPADPFTASCGTECKPGVIAERFPMQSAPDGEALVYEGFPFSPTEGAVDFDEYLSRRNEKTGWQTTILSPKAQESGESSGYQAFNPSLTSALIKQGTRPLTPEAPGEFFSLYSQDTADPLSFSSLLSAEPPNRPAQGESKFQLTYAGASSDLSRVFFEANDALTEETPFAPEAVDGGASKRNLYEWSKEGGLRLVNVQPGNTETAPGAAFGSGARLALEGAQVADLSHAISTDGSRVFWDSKSGQTYVRENAEETHLISASQRSTPDPIGTQPAPYLTASADGSRALFSSHEELTDDAYTGPIHQALALKATAGTFSLSYGGQSTGASGHGDLSGTSGTGDVVLAAAGSHGDLSAGSTVIANLTNAASFSEGMAITADGIPAGTRVAAVDTGANTLTLSAPATKSGTAVSLLAGDVQNAAGGAFSVGQAITAAGIPAGTTIAAISGSTLTLSEVPSTAGTAVGLTAGSLTVANLSTSSGTFTAGEAISAPGLSPATRIVSCSPACGPAAASLTLSLPPSSSASSIALSAALPFDASALAIEKALEALSSIGAGNIHVNSASQGPVIVLDGALAHSEELVLADTSHLTGVLTLTPSRPGTDLYEWHEGVLTDLTAGHGEGGFQGIAGQSEDLSHIYFVDTAVLDEMPNDQGNIARPGRDNLYSWHEGMTTFVATLGSELQDNENKQGDWAASPSQRTAEASPDGRWLTFLSRESLTGYENVNKAVRACEIGFERVCPEAFLYDADTGRLTCVSCNPGNERPQGPTTLRKIFLAEGSLPQPRYLSDEGRLYFDTANSLSPFDTNGNVEDVYEYEPNGVGSCTRSGGGCVSLISAGHEPVDSNFLTMDPSGKNVFFTTRDQLVLKDKDDLVDVYDAREGGGIPSETETGRGECQGEACQPLYSPPNDPTPGSSSFEGAGNVVEKKAPPRKHKKKGRHAKHKHAKRHKRAHGRAAKHNRGGAK